MYATVRRYEGVSDPSEVARLVNEGFLPIIREIEELFVGQHLTPLLPNPPHITAGEVVAHTAE